MFPDSSENLITDGQQFQDGLYSLIANCFSFFYSLLVEYFMSGQSAFDKRYVDPKDQSNVEGLLEHFNLPPKAIEFLRKNKRMVQVALVVIVAAVVSYSLYGSYQGKRIESSASALSVALKSSGAEKKSALQDVADDYSGTGSATWAQVELAHLAMAEKDFEGAGKLYTTVHSSLKTENPLYPLTLLGMAQAAEAKGDLDSAYTSFEQLKGIGGYQLTGYNGLARIHTSRDEIDKALGIYGQYLAVLASEGEESLEKAVVEERIARLKARQ